MDQTGTLENFFKECGHSYQTIGENESVNIEDKNIEILSFDHNKNKIVFKKVISLTRKYDAITYSLFNKKRFLLKGTEAHQVYDPILCKYVSIKKAVLVLNSSSHPIEVYSKLDKGISPILDIEVADTHCYFTNNILSHNTPGGNALKFYASQRVDVRRIGGVKDSDGNLIANQTRVKIIKSKVSPPFKFAEIEIRYGEGIDKLSDLLNISVEANLIDKAGAWYSSNIKFKDIKVGDKLGHGAIKTRTFLKDNPKYVKELMDKLNA